jgi:hypothetical protein
VLSVGVKVTLQEAVPAPGAVPGVVQAKLPAGVLVPPVSVEAARVWPKVMALAVGQVIVAVALPVTTLTVLVAVL